MSKVLKIGEHTFTVHKSKHASVDNLARYAGRDLLECYTKPSISKISIYADWCNWVSQNNIMYFGVSSYNSFSFTLQGLTTVDGVDYILSITPSSNKAFIIE